MGRTNGLAGLVVALLLVPIIVVPAAAQAPQAGTVTRLEGTAAVARTAAPQPTPLKIKDAVYLRDLVTTGQQSRAQMLLGGKAIVTMREQSALRITEVPGVSTVDMTDGRLKLAVRKDQLKPGERIEVRTATAIVAVRGTSFIVELLRVAAGLLCRVTMLDGVAEITALDPATGRPRGAPIRLNPLQRVDVTAAGAGTVQTVSRSDADRLDATFAFTLKPGTAASADLVKKRLEEQAASDAAALQSAGGGRTPPGTQSTTPSLSGDNLRLRGNVGVPPSGGGGSTRGN